MTSSAFAFSLPVVVHIDKQLNINTRFDSTSLQLLLRLFLWFNRHVFLSLCAALVMAGLCSNSKLRIALQCSSGLCYFTGFSDLISLDNLKFSRKLSIGCHSQSTNLFCRKIHNGSNKKSCASSQPINRRSNG